jgi:hypothetical protein
MTAALAGRGRARPSWQAAAGLAGLALLLVIASVVFTAVTGNLAASGGGGTIVLAVTFAATGFLVALRQPRNPVGWLLLCTGLSAAFTTATGLYTLLDYSSLHGSLPLGRLVFLAGNTLWPVSIFTAMAAVLLFPDGRLPRPWRRALWAYAAVGVAVLISQAIPAAVMAATSLQAAATGRLTVMPGGAAVQFLVSGLPVLAAVPFAVAWVIRQVASYRRAGGDVRQQFKWFTAGAAVSLLGSVVLTVAESGISSSGLAGVANILALYVTGVAFPLGMGVATLRYRLYDIDRIISRTLAYALVTGLLIGVYAGLVLLATRVLSFASPVAVAASTLAAAALFSPLRRRIQRLVDRRFNRARYDADAAIAAFAARLQDATDLAAAQADLMATAGAALEPVHLSCWLAGPGWPPAHQPIG